MIRGTNNAVETDDRITTYTYDVGGRLVSDTDATGAVTAYRYDAEGNVTRKTLQNRLNADAVSTNDVTVITYDNLNRQVKTQDISTGIISEVEYNSFNQVTGKRTYAGVAPTTWQEVATYDRAGRSWRSNSGDGVTKVYVYDANGNSTLSISGTLDMSNMTLNQVLAQKELDAQNGTTQQTFYTFSQYDAKNQLVNTIQPSMDSTIDVCLFNKPLVLVTMLIACLYQVPLLLAQLWQVMPTPSRRVPLILGMVISVGQRQQLMRHQDNFLLSVFTAAVLRKGIFIQT